MTGRSAHGSMRKEGVSAWEAFLPVYSALVQLETDRNAHIDREFVGEVPYALSFGIGAALVGIGADAQQSCHVLTQLFDQLDSDHDYDPLFAVDKPVIFAYHGYPWLIHRLTYRRTNHHNIHVRGYKEEGTTTTPFDMTVLNQLDRFSLAMDVIDRVPRLQATSGHAREELKNKLIEHRVYVRSHGEDLPEIQHWAWGADGAPGGRGTPSGPEVTTDDQPTEAPEG